MKRTKLLLFGALPGLALGYLVLTGMLLGRVRPLPIAFLPESDSSRSPALRERVAA